MNPAFSTDKPIRDDNDDAFRRAPFAHQLAKTILEKELSDGYVIGLYSPWGYGKTSTLNMIENSLKVDDSVVVIKFNPWIFADQQTMISGFFHTIADAIDAEIETKGEKIGSMLKKYGGVLAPFQSADAAAKTIGDAISVTLEDLRDRVETVLSESGKRVIIIIDDVDRLDKDELFQLFKLIKIAVDFKQVIYLIAFDDKVVSSALSQRFPESKESGQDFIEKIIQVPLNLPLIDQNTMNKYVLGGLDGVLAAYEINVSEAEINRFRLVFDEHLAKEISTPRMANRYLNSLKFILPLAGSEINTVDLLLIEAIRLIYPKEYAQLRRMRDEMCGQGRDFFMDEKDARKLLAAEVEKITKEKPQLKELLAELFPAVENALKEYGQSFINEKELKKMKRVASYDYFDRYFTYGIPMGDVSDTDVLAALEQKSAEDIACYLKEVITQSSSDVVIKKIRDYEEEIKNGAEIVKALAILGDQFPDPLLVSFDDTALEASAKCMTILIRSLPKEERLTIAKEVIDSSTNMHQLVHFVKWINLESKDKDQKKSPILKELELKEFLTHIGKRIKSEAAAGRSIHSASHRLLVHLYDYWRQGEGKKPVSAHLLKTIKTYDDACDLLTQYLSSWHSGNVSKRGDFDSPTYQFMAQMVEPQHLYDILVAHDESLKDVKKYQKFTGDLNKIGNESDRQFRDIVARQFLYVHRQMLKPEGERKEVVFED